MRIRVQSIDDVGGFIATDINGVDIYEGDTVTDDNTFWSATYADYAAIRDGVVYRCDE